MGVSSLRQDYVFIFIVVVLKPVKAAQVCSCTCP